MCNLKGRGHGYIIFEFIPESFLHPQLERNQMSWHWLSFLTFRRLAVLGSMTFRISRTSCVRDDPTWPCLIMNDLGIPSKWASRAFAPLRWVLVFLRLTMSRTWTKFKRKEGYRNMFVSKASTKYSEFHVHHAWNLEIFHKTNESLVIISWTLYTHLFSCAANKTTSESGEIYTQLTFEPNRIYLPPQSQNLPARDPHCDWNMGRPRPPRWTQVVEKTC